MKAWVESYGCTMNQGEGAQLEVQLASLGYTLVDDPADAELVIVNTCTVIRETERRMLKRLKELSGQRRNIVVTGCLAAVQPAEAVKHAPHSLIIPPRNYDSFTQLIEERFGPTQLSPTPPPISPTSAILPIAQGCLGNCSYCITRLARGTLSSYTPSSLVSDAKSYIGSGATELLITAQDTAAYGLDIGTDLGQLLTNIASIPGDFRIRVGMMNLRNLDRILPSFLKAWRSPKIYQFIHLPVQSGSERILEAMNRHHTPEEFEHIVEILRNKSPNMCLATDVITGFPGETDDDHHATVELLGRVRPDIVNVTRYSPRPGTDAARSQNQIPGWIRKERSREISALRMRISKELYCSHIGMEKDILITEYGKRGTMIGRTDSYRPVVVKGKHVIGTRLPIIVVDATSTYMIGEYQGI